MYKILRWSWLLAVLMVFSVACESESSGTTFNDNSGENTNQNAGEFDEDPVLEVRGEEALSWDLDIGQAVTAQFEVSNVGGGILDFSIRSDEWLVLSPVNGEAAAGESVAIEAGISCSDKDDFTEISSTVTITSNGGDFEFIATLRCRKQAPGMLEVVVQGLPDEQDAAVVIEGPDDFMEPITATERFDEATVGTYTITAEEVGDGTVYSPNPQEISVDVLEDTDALVTIEYELVPGSILVHVEGLPDGAEPDLNVKKDGDEWPVSEEGLVVGLDPGDYTVVGEDYDENGAVYEASDTQVTVTSAEVAETTIVYHLVPAQLHIEVTGTLDGNDADIDVLGPDGFLENPTQSESFTDLEPGEYTVEARDVVDGSAVYRVSGGQTLSLNSGDEETVTVHYELITGDIIVQLEEIGIVDYRVELTGPDGFEEVLDGDATFSGAPVGNYEVTVVNAPVDPYGNDSYIELTPAQFELNPGQQEMVDIVVRAAYIVVTEADSGEGSLRFVVDDVIDNTIIEFIDDVSEIHLSGGQIVVAKEISIAGRIDDPIIVDGDNGTRMFHVEGGARLSITELILRNGFGNPGGAIRVVGDGFLSVGRVAFEDNTSAQAGGAIAVADVAILEVYDSLFSGNIADGWGSAIDAPGGEADVDVTIRRSLFQNNIAGGNGAAVDTSGTLKITDSTFINNQSAGRSAAILVFSGVGVMEGLTVVQNTIENTSFNSTAGVYVNWDATATLRRSIVVDNHGGDVGGTTENITSLGFNVIGEVNADFDELATDQLDVNDPGLEALADNGGYTMTMALMDQSPARAIMFGQQCIQDGDLFEFGDQRGSYRPAGAFCSAGAYELDTTVETFEDADMSRDDFNATPDSFSGVEGIEWEYLQVKRQQETESDPHVIDGTSVVLSGDDQGWIATQNIADGIASISMLLARTDDFSEQRIEVFVDGVSVGTSPDVSGEPRPYLYAIELDDEINGPFDLMIESIGDGHITLDNMSWR